MGKVLNFQQKIHFIAHRIYENISDALSKMLYRMNMTVMPNWS